MYYREFETDRMILRTLAPSEANLALAYYKENKDFLEAYEPTRDVNFYTEDHQRRMIVVESADIDQRRTLRLWLFLKDAKGMTNPIGNFAFSNIIHGCFLSCYLGYKLDHRYVGQGYMKEALTKGIEIIFDQYGLHRIEANIMPKNLPSLILAESLGFKNEGTSPSYLKINGKWEDHIHMVLLNNII